MLEKFLGPEHPTVTSAEKEKIRQREALAAAEKKKEETAMSHLRMGRVLFTRGDWEGALRENQMIVTFFQGKTPTEEALFMLGLIQLHPDNPQRDFGKSIESMKRLVKEYPNGFFSQQAKTWIGFLMMQEKTGKENEKLNKDHEKLTREHEKLTRDLEKMSKMLEEYKKVDIEIEGKKSKKGR